MHKTQLKKIIINKFRGLKDVEIEFGNYVTVICGKNGTSKSTILGIAAQIFSFETDHQENKAINYQTITGGNFKSLPTEHFRFSKQFDMPGTMSVEVELIDGYSNLPAKGELTLSSR